MGKEIDLTCEATWKECEYKKDGKCNSKIVYGTVHGHCIYAKGEKMK